MMKSAHPDMALWSYEKPSRGYFGFHLRAKTGAAREKLRQKLAVVGPSEKLVLRFGATLADAVGAGWARTEFGFLTLTRGDQPAQISGLSIAVPNESWALLLSLLDQADRQEEGSVDVITPDGHMPLWVWWDAE